MPLEKHGVMIILSSPSVEDKTTLIKILSNLDNFKVQVEGKHIFAADFIIQTRKENRPEIIKIDQNEPENEKRVEKSLEPSNFRPRGQKGLEEYEEK